MADQQPGGHDDRPRPDEVGGSAPVRQQTAPDWRSVVAKPARRDNLLAYSAGFSRTEWQRKAEYPRPLACPPHLLVTGEAVGTPPDSPVVLKLEEVLKAGLLWEATDVATTVDRLRTRLTELWSVRLAPADIRICTKPQPRPAAAAGARGQRTPRLTTGTAMVRIQRRATVLDILESQRAGQGERLVSRSGTPCRITIHGAPHLDDAAVPAHRLWVHITQFIGRTEAQVRPTLADMLTELYDSLLAQGTEARSFDDVEAAIYAAADASWTAHEALPDSDPNSTRPPVVTLPEAAV